jgi:prepilin-type N-terminal cleavage/methylation domain-containing protein
MKKHGFTLIELMIVVAIIGILAAVALPKFGDLIIKSKEGATKGKLGAVRSALSIYYSDLEGNFPNDPSSLTVSGKYMTTIPTAGIPNYHGDSSSFNLNLSSNDGGGWQYNNLASDANFGHLLVNCTHTDAKGTVWTTY